jgi:transcriptional regulator with XRE-family HTH domain
MVTNSPPDQNDDAQRTMESYKIYQNVDKVIAYNLRRLRLESGLSQEQLAGRLNLKYQQIQKYESCISRIAIARLLAMAHIFNVGIDAFFIGLPDSKSDRAAQIKPDPIVVSIINKLSKVQDQRTLRQCKTVIDAIISSKM